MEFLFAWPRKQQATNMIALRKPGDYARARRQCIVAR